MFKKKRKGVERYNELVELLMQPDAQLVQTVTNICTPENQATILESLVYILDRTDKAVDVIKTSCSEVIDKTTDGAVLFRDNSAATKLMTAYSKMIGKSYLETTTKWLIGLLLNTNEGFEVNPSKASPEDNVEENLQNLMDWCERFVEQIVQSVDACPPQFREICHHLQTQTMSKFPKSRYMVVGGFIFLRFFCPAILSPHEAGIMDEQPTQDQRRKLVYLTKALQNLSNGVQYGSKEAYLGAMNDFIEDYQELLYEFFDVLASPPESMLRSQSQARSNANGALALEDSDMPSLHTMHTFIHGNRDALLAALRKDSNNEVAAAVERVLDQLGPPSKT